MAGARGKNAPAKRSTSEASGGRQPKASRRDGANWLGYVNVPINDEQREHYHAWRRSSDVVEDETKTVLAVGYKLSVVYDAEQDAYQATAYARFHDMADAGLATSAWAEDLFESLAAVTYIVGVLARCNLLTFDVPKAKRFNSTF